MSELFRLRGVSKRWPDGHIALADISFALAPGTLTALIGPSGAGKTTVLRLAAGLETPDAGEISNPFGQVGMVFQEPSLWPHLTLVENVSLPLRLTLGVANAVAARRAADVLTSWGLAHRLDAYPAELSGGEQQRGALARACVLEPKVLCLDEVASALDPEAAAAILQSIIQMKKEDSLMLLATHQLGFVVESADQVVFMDGGHVIEIGDAQSLLQAPRHDRVKRFLAAARLS